MTNLTRLTISFPPDIDAAINKIKETPDFREVPKSKIVCALIRRGIPHWNLEAEGGDGDSGERDSERAAGV